MVNYVLTSLKKYVVSHVRVNPVIERLSVVWCMHFMHERITPHSAELEEVKKGMDNRLLMRVY